MKECTCYPRLNSVKKNSRHPKSAANNLTARYIGFASSDPSDNCLRHPDGTPCVQGILTGCVGGVGGVAHGPVSVVKSKNSVMSGIEASRAVRFGIWNRVSISLSAAVESIGVCETKFFLLKGEITISGTRKPVSVKSPGWFVAGMIGGMPSGLGTEMGPT